jgi:hypothetical protein
MAVSLDSDLNTLQAFLADFDPYLKSETIFWSVGANSPALTVGGLLLIRRTLQARRSQMSAAQSAAFDALDTQADTIFGRWPVNIEKKTAKEINARLNAWVNTLEELGEGYAQAVTPRVQISLMLPLVARLPEAATFQNWLAAYDTRLRAKLAPSGFIWEAVLQDSFPQSEFWFLYGKPTGRP